MRLHIISDLHLEFGPFKLPAVEADVSILAGDIGPGVSGLRWIRENIPNRPVIYVLGNHEYYGNRIPQLTERLRKFARGSNTFLLENEAVTIGGVAFFGATLWTDYALDGDQELGAAIAFNYMSDFNTIKVTPGFRKLRPEFILSAHYTSRKWIEETARATTTPKVIVTHHAPHPKSISPRYVGSRLNPAFASDLTELIHAAEAKLWIHGHTHSNSDYRIGKTRILNNPRGYIDENADGFKADLVVEI